MHRSETGRWVMGGLILGIGLLTLAGCRKLTRERFDMIQQGVDDQEDVRQILGKPRYVADGVWHYEDLHRHVNAQVTFSEDGRVTSKQWINAKTGEWEGQNPGAPEPPPGEVRERSTKTRRIDD